MRTDDPGPHRGALTTRQRYWLFQLPGLGIVVALLAAGVHWFSLPLWAFLLAAGLWVAKDGLLYPFVKTAYEGSKPSGPEALVGSVGTAQEKLAPHGIIKIGAELWRAESSAPVEAGQTVRVAGTEGMTMLVESIPTDAAELHPKSRN